MRNAEDHLSHAVRGAGTRDTNSFGRTVHANLNDLYIPPTNLVDYFLPI